MEQDSACSHVARASPALVPNGIDHFAVVGLLPQSSTQSISLAQSTPLSTSSPDIDATYVANEPEQTYFVGRCRLCYCISGRSSCTLSTSLCVACEHSTQDHMDSYPCELSRWDRTLDCVDGLCKREGLVKTIVSRLHASHAVVIRSTPMTGKTTLLNLVASYLLNVESSSEPVFVRFFSDRVNREGDSTDVWDYLHRFLESNFRTNYIYRKRRNIKQISFEEQLKRPKVWLIDEATETYGFRDWWETTFKNNKPDHMFLLACVHGSAQTSILKSDVVESQSVQFPLDQRIELIPTSPGEPCMLFNSKEVEEAVMHWVDRIRESDSGPSAIETGVVDLLMVELACTDRIQHINNAIRDGKWTGDIFHRVILEDKFFRTPRGLYTPDLLSRVESAVEKRADAKLTKGLILKVLKMVVDSPNGVIPINDAEKDIFQICHFHGFFFTQAEANGIETRYLFPSPFHKRRVATKLFSCIYRKPETRNLRDVCISIINRFGSKALAARSETQRSQSSNVPEAAYQSEFYRCAFAELGVPPMPEYTKPRKRGRVDFWLPEEEWMVELLRDGTSAMIREHQERFEDGGKYDTWKIAKDFIIINFVAAENARCFLESDEDKTSICEKTYHVIMKGDDTAEMRKYNGELVHIFLWTENGLEDSLRVECNT